MKQLFIFSFIILCKISFAQNVGINTTTPQAALDVYGDVIYRSAELVVPNGITLALDVNSNKFSYYRVNGPTANFKLAGITQGVEGRLVTLFNRSGFSMQLNNLDVTASVNNRIITGTNADLMIDNKTIVNLQYDGAEQKWVVLSNSKSAGGGGSNLWGGLASGNIYNSNTGNVGIGTNNPFYKLDVRGDGSFYIGSKIDYLPAQGSYYFTSGALNLSSPNLINYPAGIENNVLAIDGNQIQSYVRSIDDGSISDYATAMSLNALGGNLGIGTNTALANAKLTIQTDANFSTGLLIRNPSNSIEFKTYLGGPANGNAISMGTTGNNPFVLYTNSSNRLFIHGNGNLGIGTDVLDANTKLTLQTPTDNYSALSLSNPSGSAKFNAFIGGSANGNSISLGTPGAMPLVFYTNGANRIYINSSGNVGIGTDNPTYKLSVNGNVRSKEVVVESGWADFVFDKKYNLLPLLEVEKYINKNKHLPNIPSAEEIQTNGLKVGELQTKMMQKIEELTLYVIELKKEIELLKEKNN